MTKGLGSGAPQRGPKTYRVIMGTLRVEEGAALWLAPADSLLSAERRRRDVAQTARPAVPQASSRSPVGLTGSSTPQSEQMKPTTVGTRPFQASESGSEAIRTGLTL